MQIGSLNSNYVSKVNTPSVNFKGASDAGVALKTDEFTKMLKNTKKTESSFTKKVGTGLASALYPGLGQLTNGQMLKAACFAIGEPVAIAAGFLLGGPFVALGIAVATHLWNIYDAVKNA